MLMGQALLLMYPTKRARYDCSCIYMTNTDSITIIQIDLYVARPNELPVYDWPPSNVL